MTPRRILVAGWLLLVLYAFPGYMSYDSVVQLLQARDGVFEGGHPPMMGILWRITDSLIAGPLPMLLIQVTCFVAGMFLLLRHALSERAAAITAVAIALFPPVSAVLAVIWKDSQMAAYLTLGAALLLSERRKVRLGGLALLFLATAMRYNAAAITLPIVVLLFVWAPDMARVKRYAIAVVAWLAVTFGAMKTNSLFTSDDTNLWTDSIALFDITGTLRYADALSDETLRTELAGMPLKISDGIQAYARSTPGVADLPPVWVQSFGGGTYIPGLWSTTRHLFGIPERADERAAITRAWKSIVLGNKGAYLRYRWEVTRERILLSGDVPGSAYVWFGNAINIEESIALTEHHAVPSKLQKQLQSAMLWLGTSWLFRPWIYIVLALVCLALARIRISLALVLSGLANEAALFILAPTIDYRYSVWLVIAALAVLATVIGRRVGAAATTSPPSPGLSGPESARAAP